MNEEIGSPNLEGPSSQQEDDEAPQPRDDSDYNLKFNFCKYCKGIVPKNVRRMAGSHCSKICLETNKMVPSECYFPETGKLELKATFTVEKDWSYYREVIKDKASTPTSFFQVTQPVAGLEAGMKLECLDVSNPVNYCVATVIKISSHRLCLRYDGFGQDPTHDFWCNFQSEELFPIGWCARNNYHLQPPTGISCTHTEWKAFLSRTLTGALAAPMDLFKKPETRRQLRCHSYLPGDRVEVIHPDRPDLIVSAKVTKSLGPYYFLVTTDPLPNIPNKTFYGYADCPSVYPNGWCESRGLELLIPSVQNGNSEIKMVRKAESLMDVANHNSGKRSRMNSFKISNKLEALDGEIVRVATVAEIFGRVALLIFDDHHQKKFIDKNALDIFPIGWSERTNGCLYTPYGPVDFHNKNPMIGGRAKKSASSDVQSASFSQFQKQSFLKPLSTTTTSTPQLPTPPQPTPPHLTPVPPHLTPVPAPQSTLVPQIPITTTIPIAKTNEEKSATPKQEIEGEAPQESEPYIVESPLSPTITSEVKKSDMDQFVIWLLNKYELDLEDTCSVVKADLVESFTEYTNRVLSPRWFTSIYKLFPYVTSTRKLVNDRFVNCLKFLKEKIPEKSVGVIYVKDAVEFLKHRNFAVQLGSDRLVTFLLLGSHAKVPEDTQEIFQNTTAAENSGIFVISSDINNNDFTLNNFKFHYEQTPCLPPVPKISNLDEFRAAMILCKQATMCTGVEYQPKNEYMTPKQASSKFIRNGRKYSLACNIVAYPHKGNLCIHCKNIRGKYNTSHTTQQPPDILNEVLEETLSEDVDEMPGPKDDEDNPTLELKIFFNKTCYPGLYLNPEKISQIAPHTPQEKPAQALKYLIERLIEISVNKEKFLEIIEAGFGTRIFNKAKDKVVKKGLFRFNTKNKVLRFMRRLIKRLNCCDSFLSLEQAYCHHGCKGHEASHRRKKRESNDSQPNVSNNHNLPPTCSANVTSPPLLVQSHLQSPSTKTGKLNAGQVINTAQGNVQLLYQLPSLVVTTGTTTSPGQHLVVQNSGGKNVNLQHRFPQGTQFFLPQNSGNVTYMVVSNKDKMAVSVQSPSVASTSSSMMHPVNHSVLTSPPAAGVSQILANLTKTNLVTDIDNPMNKPSNNMWVKREPARYEQHQRILDDPNRKGNQSSHEGVKHHQSPPGERSQYDPMRPVVQTSEKGHQIHVHKVHHGNARVKYVEFKPVQDGNPSSNAQSQHNFNQYYQSSAMGGSSSQHLSVQTQGQSPKSPLHSPPNLRPPPALPPRSIALHSPPSLVLSPDVRPRFEFQGNQGIRTQVYSKQSGLKSVNQIINLPRLPIMSHQPNSPAGLGQMGKSTVIQAFRSPGQETNPKLFQASNSGAGTTSAVTVTMTYIPIQSSTSNKLVYVPVNSLQTNQGQPVVLYPQNQTLKDRNGKPVILSPQVFQGNKNVVVVPSKAENSGAFTTVRIQGNSQSGSLKSPVTTVTTSSQQPTMKTFRYQFGNNLSHSPGVQRERDVDMGGNHMMKVDGANNESYGDRPIKIEEGEVRGGEIMNLINGTTTHGPPSSPSIPPGSKRKFISQQDGIPTENDTPDPVKQKKKRGRPPSSGKIPGNKNARSKLSMIQDNPLAASSSVNPLTLANRVLTEAFFKKQQQAQNRMNYVQEPLLKCPNLPNNPEMWSSSDVYTFLLATDCAQYADALKEEEMDGKSFLLLTRDALMEFKGFRLGPALKIVGYAAYLRAKHRMLNMSQYPPQNISNCPTPQVTLNHPPSYSTPNFPQQIFYTSPQNNWHSKPPKYNTPKVSKILPKTTPNKAVMETVKDAVHLKDLPGICMTGADVVHGNEAIHKEERSKVIEESSTTNKKMQENLIVTDLAPDKQPEKKENALMRDCENNSPDLTNSSLILK